MPTQRQEPIEGGTRVTTIAYDSQGNPQSVSVSARGETRTTTYTVDSHGQLTGIDGPRTEVSDVQTFAYDPVSGDRSLMTDAAGHATQYPAYDADGRLTGRIDPNGLRSEYRYDPRGRLTHVIERNSAADPGEITAITWNPAGWVERITFADASFAPTHA